MRKVREPVDTKPVKGGWAALGNGWAVHGKTEEEAIRLYHEAIERHKEIEARPLQLREEVTSQA